MGYIFMIVVGAILGWQAAFMLRAEDAQGLVRNMGASVLGALLAGLLFAPRITQGNLAAGTYTPGALLITMAGALAALVAAYVLHRRALI